MGLLVEDSDPAVQLSEAVSDAYERQTWSDRVSCDAIKPLKAYSFCQFFFFPLWVLSFCCYLAL